MNEWMFGVHAAQLLVAVIVAGCGLLAIYVRLSTKAQLSDFLEKLTVKLDATFVRKETFQGSLKEADATHAAILEVIKAAAREQTLNARIIALELRTPGATPGAASTV
jgi:hypothetical protein